MRDAIRKEGVTDPFALAPILSDEQVDAVWRRRAYHALSRLCMRLNPSNFYDRVLLFYPPFYDPDEIRFSSAHSPLVARSATLAPEPSTGRSLPWAP